MRHHRRRRSGRFGSDVSTYDKLNLQALNPTPKAKVKGKLERVGDCCPIIKTKCHTAYVQVEGSGRESESGGIQHRRQRVCEVSAGSAHFGEKVQSAAKADLIAVKAELKSKGCIVTVQGPSLGSVKSAPRKGGHKKKGHGRKHKR